MLRPVQLLCCAALLWQAVPGPAAPSFREDIIPLLTRAGCNQGACHGKLAGQNGFKLSLRGFAPEEDFDHLTREGRGRRLNFAQPDASLLLTKSLNTEAHEGGARFAVGSREHTLLRDWILAGAPGPVTNEARVTSLRVAVAKPALKPGDKATLAARATYTDGRERDVTWLAQFFSNDESTVKVTPEGVATAVRAGETAVRVHFQGLVEVVPFTMAYDNKVKATDFAARHNAVDDAVFKKLQALRLPPAPLCDDATFCRRVHLDLTGALPGAEVAAAFAQDPSPDKRTRLVDKLIGSPRFVDYWTLQLADLLQNRKERDHDVRGAKGVRAFHTWLRAQVAANRPWDALARDVLTARGPVAETPAVGYFIYNVGEKRQSEQSDLPDSVAQAFLGTRIGCARCHNHPLERYTQDDFYHFAAFFARVSLDRKEPVDGVTQLLVATERETQMQRELKQAEEKVVKAKEAAAAPGLEPKEAEKRAKEVTAAEKRVADLTKQLDAARAKPPAVQQPRTRQMMAARPLDRRELALPEGADPRETFTSWLTAPDNPFFAAAMVNRVWRHFMGVGLVEPVDDLRDSNPPSNPELWALLKREFAAGHDLRKLMRLIVTSRAYQLSADTTKANAADQRFHSHFYARRLPAEVLLDAVSDVTAVPESFAGYPAGLRAVQLPDPTVNSYFLTLFGRSDRVTACACERSGDVTLPQLLHLNNGEDVLKKIKSPAGRLANLLKQFPDDAALTEQLYLLTLGRRPSAAEREAIMRQQSAADPREAFFADLFWALLNTKEFAFNH